MKSYKTLIEDFCEEGDNFSFYPDYSGRGMSGEKCIGIFTTQNPARTIAELINYSLSFFEEIEDLDAFISALSDVETDSLGKGYILYWPSLT